MVVKVKEKFEKTTNVKNNIKPKIYISRGQRNVRYHNGIPSEISGRQQNKIIQCNFIISYFFYFYISV